MTWAGITKFSWGIPIRGRRVGPKRIDDFEGLISYDEDVYNERY